MNYVKSLNLLGVEAKEIPCITGKGAPTEETVGAVGCLYMDITNSNTYKCVAITDGKYQWESSNNYKTKLEQESAVLGEELIAANGWTTDGWTGDLESGFTHTSGNTSPLIFTMPEETGTKLYQVSFKLSTTGLLDSMKLFVSVGNSATFDLYGYDNEMFANEIRVGIRSVENGNLQIIPAEDFTDTITDISIKEITSGYEGIKQILDSNGDVTFEQHCTLQELDNMFMGQNTGRMNTTGRGNTGIGGNVLINNTTGFWNVGIGRKTLMENTVGTRNLALGLYALKENISGHRNIGLGTFALIHNKTGNWNIAIGADSQDHNETGDANIAVGFATLYENKIGSKNVAIGYRAMHAATNANNTISIGEEAGYYSALPDNINIGNYAGYKIGGRCNISIGKYAGRAATDSTAQYNIFIGASVGQSVTTAQYNVILGHQAGMALTTGTDNIFIGTKAGNTATYSQYCIVIGKEAQVSGHYQLNIGDLLKGSLRPTDRYLSVNGGLDLSQIPTTDPAITGRVWNDNGTLKISMGAVA